MRPKHLIHTLTIAEGDGLDSGRLMRQENVINCFLEPAPMLLIDEDSHLSIIAEENSRQHYSLVVWIKEPAIMVDPDQGAISHPPLQPFADHISAF